jgi:hypothetical protein
MSDRISFNDETHTAAEPAAAFQEEEDVWVPS